MDVDKKEDLRRSISMPVPTRPKTPPLKQDDFDVESDSGCEGELSDSDMEYVDPDTLLIPVKIALAKEFLAGKVTATAIMRHVVSTELELYDSDFKLSDTKKIKKQ